MDEHKSWRESMLESLKTKIEQCEGMRKTNTEKKKQAEYYCTMDRTSIAHIQKRHFFRYCLKAISFRSYFSKFSEQFPINLWKKPDKRAKTDRVQEMIKETKNKTIYFYRFPSFLQTFTQWFNNPI